MTFPFFKQYDQMDCGPTCLRMVSMYYGKTLSMESLRNKSQIGKEGVSLLGISEAAENIGFRTHSVRLSYEELVKDALLPCVLYWDQNHFVTLYKAGRNVLIVGDPAFGLIRYSRQEFVAHWVNDKSESAEEGIALLLEPTPGFYNHAGDDFASPGSSESVMAFKNIFNYLLPYKKLILQLFMGLAVGSILQLIVPFLTQSIVDVGINTSNIHFIYIVLLAQMALVVGRLSVEFVRSWILLHISSRINISILTDFLIKLMKLPISFFESKKTGDILQRMNDHQRIESFLTGSSINILFSVTSLVMFSIVLAVFNIYIFSVFLVASAVYSIWILVFLKRRRALDYLRFAVASKEQSLTIQLIQGMQEIKLGGIEKPMRWKWEGLQAKLFRLNIRGLSLSQWQQSGALLVNEGKNIFITFLSAKSVIDGHMTLGAMLAVQYIIGQINAPIEQMVSFVQSWQTAKISMDRLNEIHTVENEEPEHRHLLKELPDSFKRQLVGGRQPGHSDAGDCISLRNISFTYPGAGNEPVLRGIDLDIPKGRTTAIVGVSGSGKTTLIKLLLRFYDPQKGEIRVGGTLLSNISHKVWRGHCGVVMQESFIFSETITKNIAVGTGEVETEKLKHAVRIANIQDFIESLPLGLNTKIGPEGVGVSMGQRQRILIARSVYRDPEFIFLDEATNSLDANNERKIVENLESFLQGKTVVVIAHRLSTVKQADKIVVLKNGSIAEQGTHQELLNLKGEYFSLIKNQLELGT